MCLYCCGSSRGGISQYDPGMYGRHKARLFTYLRGHQGEIMKKTEAVVFTGVGEVHIQEVELPEPGPGEVQVRTSFSTISAGTEGWILQNLFTWQPTRYPCIPGYQRVGVIEAVGQGVEKWRVGQRVMATRSQWTGSVNAQSGSHAARGNTPESEIYALPDEVDDVDAAGTVVAQVGYNAASRAVIEPGNWAVVYGDGLIGQSAAQAMRARGGRVILVGHRPERLRLAAAHSADAVINNHETDVLAAVHSYTGGQPVTVVLDSVQDEKAEQEYIPLLERTKGQIVYCGFTPGTTWADMGLLQRHELTTHYISGWTRPRMEATIKRFAEGKMRLRPLVTHLVSYQRAPEMYRLHQDKSVDFLGVTLDWTGSAS